MQTLQAPHRRRRQAREVPPVESSPIAVHVRRSEKAYLTSESELKQSLPISLPLKDRGPHLKAEMLSGPAFTPPRMLVGVQSVPGIDVATAVNPSYFAYFDPDLGGCPYGMDNFGIDSVGAYYNSAGVISTEQVRFTLDYQGVMWLVPRHVGPAAPPPPLDILYGGTAWGQGLAGGLASTSNFDGSVDGGLSSTTLFTDSVDGGTSAPLIPATVSAGNASTASWTQTITGGTA